MKQIPKNTQNTNKKSNKKPVENVVKLFNETKQVKSVADAFLLAIDLIDDPRDIERNDHPIQEILFIAVVAVMCGANSYPQIAKFGKTQIEWFRQFIPMKKGYPSHDTIYRVFRHLKPDCLRDAYQEMLSSLKLDDAGNHLAIDGKVARGAFNIKGQSLLRTVSAWDSENGVSLGQVATKNDEGKDVGEFNTIPILVGILDVEGKVITIDAGGCYVEIIECIVDGGGDFIVTLKGNQPTLYAAVQELFAEAEKEEFKGLPSYTETSKGHGRIETRRYYSISFPQDERFKKWPNLHTVMLGIFTREVKGKTTEFRRYYISSLPYENVEHIGRLVRSHWSIENSLHWVLDVSMGEGANRTRKDNGQENLSQLRRIALTLLNRVKGKKTTPVLTFRAAIDPDFRTQVLLNTPK